MWIRPPACVRVRNKNRRSYGFGKDYDADPGNGHHRICRRPPGRGVVVPAGRGEVRPESIYHLAGYAHVGRSFQETEAAWTGNLIATRSLYDAVLRWGAQPRI